MDYSMIFILILALTTLLFIFLWRKDRKKKSNMSEIFTFPLCIINEEGVITDILNRENVADCIFDLRTAIGSNIIKLLAEEEDRMLMRNNILDIIEKKITFSKQYCNLKENNGKYRSALFYVTSYKANKVVIIACGVNKNEKITRDPLNSVIEILNHINTPIVLQDLSSRKPTIVPNHAAQSISDFKASCIEDIDCNDLDISINTSQVQIGNRNIAIGSITRNDDSCCLQSTVLTKQLSMIGSVLPIHFWKWDLKERQITVLGINEVLGNDMPKVIEEGAFVEMVRTQDRPSVINRLDEYHNNTAINIATECVIVKNNAYEFYNIIGNVTKTDEEGKPLAMIGVAINQNDKKSLESRLKDTETTVTHMDLSNQKLLTNISTMIGSPINSIMGYSQLLSEEKDPAVKQEYLRLLQTDANSLLNKLNIMLQIANVAAGTATTIKTPVDLSGIMRESYSLACNANKSDEVDIHLSIPETSTTIMVDNRYLMKVLRIMVDNAIQYTDKGSITIGYKTEDNDEVYVFISDTGRGIPASKIPTLFDPFKNSSKYQSSVYSLNLPFCKVIIERFNGSIGVNSEEGKGSTFWFTLPVGY